MKNLSSDNYDKALPNAIVSLPEIHKETIADADGKYVLTNLPNGNFSPVIYSKQVQLAFRKSTVVGEITNSDYFGEISAQGDTVQIIKEPEISVQAYSRGTQVTAQDLDFTADSGGPASIDLDSETLTIAGGTGIDTTGSSTTITIAIDSTVTTLTGTQTLTNKTLTSPT